jgi:CHAT domain-containing protein
VAAFNFAERAKGRVLLDILHSDRANPNKSMAPEDAKLEQTLKREIGELNAKIYQENIKNNPDEKNLDKLKLELQQSRHRLEEFYTNLYYRHPELQVERGDVPPLSDEKIKEMIPDQDSAVLEYVFSATDVYLFALTRKDESTSNKTDSLNLRVYKLSISSSNLKREIASFREMIEARSYTYATLANHLYEQLIAPAEKELEGKKVLCIIPDGALWELPFGALQHRARFLVEDYALYSAPSLGVLQQMERRAETNARYRAAIKAKDILIFANPSLELEAVARIQQVTNKKSPESLSGAIDEARAESEVYGHDRTTIYSGERASEDQFKTESDRYRIIEFISHALWDNKNPMYSQILLAPDADNSKEDGFLESHEVMNLNLHADMVVLAACDTARGHLGAGEGVIGLTWSFFAAGCPSTLATQWSVDSDSTMRMLYEFHRNLAGYTDAAKHIPIKAIALQRAALRLLSNKNYRNPYYWAGFTLIGEQY